MKQQTYYMETGSTNPYYNLAFEEYVLTHRTEGDYLLLWQNDNTVVIGLNQNTVEEIDPAFVEQHHIRVVRRTTGGGAVYHDLGNLNYSFITDVGDAEQLTMERFTKPIVEALRSLDLHAEASGRNDILVEGCKVSGTAQRLVGKRILHHGTLLFDSNPDMVAGALRADPEKFRSKSAKSVRSRIGNIRSFLPKDMDLPSFWAYLKTALLDNGYQKNSLSIQELDFIEKLKCSKYDTWNWNYGRSPAYTMANKQHFNGGTLEVRLCVKDGLISNICFYGDFLSLCEPRPLCETLCGCRYRREDVSEILHVAPIRTYFGTITEEEILQTIFHE